MIIKTVTVLGANGTMGKNVSAIFASFGNADVYMVSRSMEQSQKAVEEASMLVKADSIRKRLIPITYDALSEAVEKSDLVFESVAENIEIKKSINSSVEKYLSETALLCTGTSGLSIDDLAKELSESVKKRYMGVHFFNPPYSMPLCEVIPNKSTDVNTKMELKQYLEKILFRTVVEVKDEAAFLGNRIGFFFINEALQYAEKYEDRGGVDYIDAILGAYTGRSMPPIVTADFVGLDIHEAIVDNVYSHSNDCSKESFVLPVFVKKLIEKGALGKKTRIGLYKTLYDENGKKNTLVYDIKTGEYRELRLYDIPFKKKVISLLREGAYKEAIDVLCESQSEEAKIVRDFMSRYVVYSLNVAREISTDKHAADHVMATGFNWIPPFAVIEAMGGKDRMYKIIKNADMHNLELDFKHIKELIEQADKSLYDFRKFLKAK